MTPARGRSVPRDRDDEGRALNARPRDALGRPLPYGAKGVARLEEGAVREPQETITMAADLFRQKLPFHAHEVFEDAWKSAPREWRDLWKGLAQLAVGVTHAARGNRTGAARLLIRAAGHLEMFAGTQPYTIDVDAVRAWAVRTAGELNESRDSGPCWLEPPALTRNLR